MEQNHPPESQNQNIIEAIGMEPDVFQRISEDIRMNNTFTSPGHLQNKHDLAEDEANAVLLELQNQGYVSKDSNKGSYGVFPEGIQSRELTKRRKILTSRLGRAVLSPIIQTTKQTAGVTVERINDGASFITGGTKRDRREQAEKLRKSQHTKDQKWQESYQEKVKRVQELGDEHAESQ